MSDAPPTTSSRRPIEPTDLCRLRSVADVAIHPDGETAVYTVSWPDAATDENRSQLYAIGVDGDGNRQLTHGHRDSRARFSPDGARVAFLRSVRKRPTRLMILSWPVGEVVDVASFQDGANDLEWLDADRVAVLAPRRPPDQDGVGDEELARRPRIITTAAYRFNGRGYIHDRPQQVFVVAGLDGGQPAVTELGPAATDHLAIAVSPDGTQIAAIAATDDDADLTGTTHVWLHAIDGTAEPVCLTEAGGDWEALIWHPDGRLVATGTTDNSRICFYKPYLIGLPADGPTPKIEPIGDHDLNVEPTSLAGNGAVAVAGGMLFPGVRAGRVAIDRYDLDDGSRTVVHEGPHEVQAFDGVEGGPLLAAITDPRKPAELWRLDGPPTRLVGLNDDVLAELDLAETEVVRIPSTGGAEVEAFVVRPPASAPATGSARPGLVYVHGGPMTQYGLRFFDEFQMAAACGYVVIGGNPRGADGYGERWARAIVGDLGNDDWADVTALADHLTALDEVDPDRMGIGGGSYGGFMTAWALSHDRRFRAGLVERAVTSWNTMFGTSDIGNWFTRQYTGATIESDVERVTVQSPLTHAAAIAAPTLIVHSEEDWRCPIEQAEQLFSAILRNGGQATLVRFPGENHELSRSGKPSHRIERLEIVHEFFAAHLGGADFGTGHLADGSG